MDLYRLDKIVLESLLSTYRFHIAVLNRLLSQNFNGLAYTSTGPYNLEGYWVIIHAFPDAIAHWEEILRLLRKEKPECKTGKDLPGNVEPVNYITCLMQHAVDDEFEILGIGRSEHIAFENGRINQRRKAIALLENRIQILPGDRSPIGGLHSLSDIDTEIRQLSTMLSRISPGLGHHWMNTEMEASLSEIEQDFFHERPDIIKISPERLVKLIHCYTFHNSVLNKLRESEDAKHLPHHEVPCWDIVSKCTEAQDEWNDLLDKELRRHWSIPTIFKIGSDGLWKQLRTAWLETYERGASQEDKWGNMYRDWVSMESRIKGLKGLRPTSASKEPTELDDKDFADLLLIMPLLGKNMTFEAKVDLIDQTLSSLKEQYRDIEKSDTGYRSYKEGVESSL